MFNDGIAVTVPLVSSPNTVHLMILIRLATSSRRVRWRLRGRRG